MIKFSIVTVCLNAGQDLLDTIQNILEQDYENYEIIVKDGFSTDGSIEALPVDERLKIYHEKDKSIYDAMNQGVRHADGDYIIFINAGDGFYNKSVLSEIKKQIDVNSVILYGHSFNLRFKAIDVIPSQITKSFCYRSMICHQATVYRADIIKNRGYDTHFKVSADREWLMYAVIKQKYHCKYIPIIISIFKSNGLSSSAKGKNKIEQEDRELKKKYFSMFERCAYSGRNLLTFPKLRKSIASSPYWSKYYRKVIHGIYGTKVEVNTDGRKRDETH